MNRTMALRRLLPLLAAIPLALAGCGHDEHRIDPQLRAATFTFDPSVPAGDREWILAAVGKLRPEARQLIDDVDGMVTIGVYDEPGGAAVGLTRPLAPDRYDVEFNLGYLDGERRADRDVTVAHELGHVVDFALTPRELRDRLAAAIPTSGSCITQDVGDCTSPPERFADTFAKWALRGAVSAFGAGYGTLAPASLESWGAPLAELAIQIEVASR
jgi:hypothetical protein